MSSKLLFNYYTSSVFGDDVRNVSSPNWLTDGIIHFVYDYFTHEYFEHKNNDILYLSPIMSYMLMHENDEECLNDAINGSHLKNSNYTLIFMPIIDKTIAISGDNSGSHWSLLVYNKTKHTFYHYNSSNSSLMYNNQLAKQLAYKLAPYLSINNPNYHNIVDCPQQTNSFDCGVYLLIFTMLLSRMHINEKMNKKDDYSSIDTNSVTPLLVSNFRLNIKKWVDLVQKRKKEEQK